MNDLEFLKELRENVVKCKNDITRYEMAVQMIDDLIRELTERINTLESIQTDMTDPSKNKIHKIR